MIDEKDIESVKASIEAGDVYADVVSVSRSGMSRRIKFYRINDGRIERITHIIHGGYNQGAKNVCEEGVRVDGCVHTLYNFLGYERAREWNQQYHTL